MDDGKTLDEEARDSATMLVCAIFALFGACAGFIGGVIFRGMW